MTRGTRAWMCIASALALLPACSPTDKNGEATAAATSGSPSTSGSTTTDGSGTTAATDTGAMPACPGDGPEGTEPGQILPNVEVRPCEGDLIGLRDLACGHSLTLIDVGAAAFQACVDATDLFATDPEYDDLQEMGLNIVQVFLFDYDGDLPTTSFCTEYTAEHMVDFEFLIDQVGATWDIAPVHPFNVVLDEEARVVHLWQENIPENRAEILAELLQGP